MHLQEVVLFYYLNEEHLAFDIYIEGHQNLLINSVKLYDLTKLVPTQAGL